MDSSHTNTNTNTNTLQTQVQEYLNQMTDRQKKAHQIAIHHLKTSFNVALSNGFIEWKKKQTKK